MEAIKVSLGFDPENDDMEQRIAPSNGLSNCYAIGRKTYEKKRAQETVDVLDYALVYVELSNKFRYLKRLIDGVNAFLN